jgi:AraC-like DNA-binding protein
MIRLKNNKIVVTRFPLQPDDYNIPVLPENWCGPDEYSRVYFFASGRGELFIKDQDSISIIPNTVLLLKRPLTFKFAETNLKGLCLCFKDQVLLEGIQDDITINEDTINNIYDWTINSYFSEIKQEVQYCSINSELQYELMYYYKSRKLKTKQGLRIIPIHHYLKAYAAFELLNRALLKSNRIMVVNKEIYMYIKKYIEKNYTINFKNSDIADGNTYSADKMRKIFKHYHKTSIIDYRNELRIKKAKVFLQQKDLRIADIANDCGFNDQYNFSKIFKRLTGKSPKQYQIEHNQH